MKEDDFIRRRSITSTRVKEVHRRVYDGKITPETTGWVYFIIRRKGRERRDGRGGTV